MDSEEKDSYRISKILKRLTGIKFLKSRQSASISENGLKKSQALMSGKSLRKPHLTVANTVAAADKPAQKYVHYQKELEAHRLLGTGIDPNPPGKILRLPTGRKEIMSVDEDD